MIRSKLGKIIRNFLNIRPSPFLFDYRSKGKSISDAFFWRVDDEFVTYFRYSDLLKIFYNNKSSNIKIIFYDSNFNLAGCYQGLLIFDKAIEYYKNCSKIDLNKFEPYHQIGVCYRQLREYEGSIIFLNKAL